MVTYEAPSEAQPGRSVDNRRVYQCLPDSGYRGGGWAWAIVAGGQALQVAYLELLPPHPGALDRVVAQTPGDSPADEANARLIAAAPAMLSALEVAADRLSYMGNHDAAREVYQLLSEVAGYANPYDQ